MSAPDRSDRVDVVVVGCGPTGAVLANLLGLQGVRVLVLERDADVFPVPRATHLDEETLRNLRATGLLGEILPHTQPFGSVAVVDPDGRGKGMKAGTPLLVLE